MLKIVMNIIKSINKKNYCAHIARKDSQQIPKAKYSINVPSSTLGPRSSNPAVFFRIKANKSAMEIT